MAEATKLGQYSVPVPGVNLHFPDSSLPGQTQVLVHSFQDGHLAKSSADPVVLMAWMDSFYFHCQPHRHQYQHLSINVILKLSPWM